MAVEDSLTLQ